MHNLPDALRTICGAQSAAENTSAPDALLKSFETAKSAVSEAADLNAEPREFCELMEGALKIIDLVKNKAADIPTLRSLSRSAWDVAEISGAVGGRFSRKGAYGDLELANRFQNIGEFAYRLVQEINMKIGAREAARELTTLNHLLGAWTGGKRTAAFAKH